MDEAVRRLRTVGAQDAARAALKGGYPITCATCEHLKDAFDSNAQDCGKSLTCGGPIFGRAYPDYIGPIEPEHYDKMCLKCGSSDVAYHVYGAIRRFGLCENHKSIFDKVEGPGITRPLVLRVPGRLL
jgi:hypothetical protein